MRIKIIAAVAIAGLSSLGSAADLGKQRPALFSEAEVTTISGSSDGSTIVSRTFFVDRSVLHAGTPPSEYVNSEPGTTPPESPNEPGNWVPQDTTSVTITQRGGGYQRDTIFTRTIGNPWTRSSDHIFICQPVSMCWPSNVE